MEWVKGDRLDHIAPSLSTQDAFNLATSVGTALAAINRVTFDQTGFFDESLRIEEPVDVGRRGLILFVSEYVSRGLAGERLGKELTERLLKFIEEKGGILDEWQQAPCLTHSDFGGSNILVTGGPNGHTLSAVLDWEFAFSGTPFFDLGNLLRPPLGTLAGFSDGVALGYKRGGGHLPTRWREMAAIVDLSAWVEFLNRAVVPRAIIETALRQISQTISPSL